MPKRSETDSPPTQVYPATAQPLRNLIDYMQNAPNLHASHAAQGITAELQRLWQAADTVAVQGEQSIFHLHLGSPVAAQKRTQEASDRHSE